MENEYLVTVIIPTYNSGKYLDKAIESAAAQTIEQAIEIIIIDDNSNDNTAQIIERARELVTFGGMKRRIEYVVNDTRLGVAGSRNKGVELAKGKYIAFLDADDWWSSDKLERQIYYMDNNSEVPMCCCARELVGEDGVSLERIIEVAENITYDMLLRTNSISCSSVLMRKEVADKFPMHHDELHEDYICWLEILKEYKCVHGINSPMIKYRLTEGGKSRNKFKSAKMNYGVYRLMGMSRPKSLYYLLMYAFNGIKKYYG